MAIFQVVHLQEYLLQQVRNIFYYETITGNPSVSEWQDICDEIRADYITMGITKYHPNWKFFGITYREVDTQGLPSFTVNPTAGDVVGTSGTHALATQLALLVSVKGNVTKPRNGRTYMCGFTEDAMGDSVWGSGIITDAEGFIDDQSVLNGAGTNELQRVSAQWNTGGTQVVAFNNIAGAASKASTIPATQRRRRIGVGI